MSEESPLPGGSDYRGPQEALAQYTAVVAASAADTEVKGAKNPCTSRNGHMFTFLTPEGTMALRLSDELAVQACHDAQQAALARPVGPEHTDLRAGQKGQADLVEDHPLGRNHLAKILHREDELGHGGGIVARLRQAREARGFSAGVASRPPRLRSAVRQANDEAGAGSGLR